MSLTLSDVSILIRREISAPAEICSAGNIVIDFVMCIRYALVKHTHTAWCTMLLNTRTTTGRYVKFRRFLLGCTFPSWFFGLDYRKTNRLKKKNRHKFSVIIFFGPHFRLQQHTWNFVVFCWVVLFRHDFSVLITVKRIGNKKNRRSFSVIFFSVRIFGCSSILDLASPTLSDCVQRVHNSPLRRGPLYAKVS